ncbi:MAG: DUF3416 domain-containing protein [Propionibacteriaceae bacterium]|nr:DUF3416 domain-containing protein [Propionibacteriaceae bacterium]
MLRLCHIAQVESQWSRRGAALVVCFDGYMSFGRIPVRDISPSLPGGYPAKAVLGETAPIKATVFREGHDAVGAAVVLSRPDGSTMSVDMTQIEPWGLDIWQAWVRFDHVGDWTFHIEAYDNRWATWQHNAAIKFAAGQDVALMCLEGEDLFSQAKAAITGRDKQARAVLRAAQAACVPTASTDALVALTHDSDLDAVMRRYGPRPLATPTGELPIRVDRPLAQFASWYEFFPRSVGAHVDPETGQWTSGTFDDCHPLLERVAAMGFDVVYLPPIHPVGTTFRKGKNNTLNCVDDDPGSPWAIGSKLGGHDAVHPDLGGMAGFRRFVKKAKSLGLEVALDFALQASPDHPWLNDHPQWFTTRLDGTIAYAENPPKKYQDIYPINFDNDPNGIRAECLHLLEFWIARGVTVFRVDNPHTKPIDFWDWLLAAVHERHPNVLFFAEAFTRPAMVQSLATVGFQLSYTYFTWRTTRWELTTYLDEIAHETDWAMRPNFFVNTPDINPLQVRSGHEAAFAIRLILATMMSPAWGMYSGFELLEHEPLREGGEEYLNSEKYEYRPRDFNTQPNLDLLIGTLNRLRREHPALQRLRTAYVHETSDEQVFAFSKTDGDDRILVVVSLDDNATRASQVFVDATAMGLPAGARLRLHDALNGDDYEWPDAHGTVVLYPAKPAHIFEVSVA